MSRSVALRVLAALTVAVVAAACGRRDDRTPQADTAAGQVGVIDSAPASVATTVAAVLTDENEFASKGVSENAVTRSGIKSTAERLNIAPVLPDRDVVSDQAEVTRDLQA